MAAPGIPSLHFGNMTFAWSQASSFVDDDVASQMMDHFMAAGGKNFDTARIYAGGKSEEMAGRIMKKNNSREQFVIATKAHPSQPDGLSDKGMRSQLKNSLSALQIDKTEIYYLHQPDTVHPLTESLATINALVSEGLIDKFALSNYSVAEVERVLDICKSKGYPLPVAYQGLYNPINRRVESELLPLLRKNNMTFVAYNPLAAGMLTGKHTKDAEVPEGRFKNNANYLDRFYKNDTFHGLDIIAKACKDADLSMTQATYSWMLHHSMLGDGDGVLLGASKIDHLDENLACCKNAATLPDAVTEAFDQAWKICSNDAFAFWRGYSVDMPGKEGMDPGASYDTSKK
eukprot:m.207883 g.207883  ORF g.207883 m.207883 type:complete len:345 (-) comp18946_c1_seq2:162-1196(-)